MQAVIFTCESKCTRLFLSSQAALCPVNTLFCAKWNGVIKRTRDCTWWCQFRFSWCRFSCNLATKEIASLGSVYFPTRLRICAIEFGFCMQKDTIHEKVFTAINKQTRGLVSCTWKGLLPGYRNDVCYSASWHDNWCRSFCCQKNSTSVGFSLYSRWRQLPITSYLKESSCKKQSALLG